MTDVAAARLETMEGRVRDLIGRIYGIGLDLDLLEHEQETQRIRISEVRSRIGRVVP